MPSRQTVLVVDDDELLRTLIRETLQENFKVLEADDGAEIESTLKEKRVDLVVLDVTLPGDDGFSVMRRLRKQSQVPVIMLTAKSEVVDRVVGLELGADDYICKPVEMRELLARVRTVLRRLDNRRPSSAAETARHRFNGFTLDIGKRQLSADSGCEIPLTSGEFDLLRVLAEHPNETMNRDDLLEATRDRDWNPFDRSIDVLIGRLRKKIEDDPKNPEIIKTVRGTGYIFATDVSSS